MLNKKVRRKLNKLKASCNKLNKTNNLEKRNKSKIPKLTPHHQLKIRNKRCRNQLAISKYLDHYKTRTSLTIN